VEAYKKNMFALLAKPGHESETQRLQEAVGAAGADSIVGFG
jgi:hypothetical protein